MKTIKIGSKIFVNRQSETIELTVTSLGNKYYHFDNPKYRYIKEYDAVQIKVGSKWGHYYTHPFNSPQDAEYWLEGKLAQLK